MLFALGLLTLFALWWLGRNSGRLPFGLTSKRLLAYGLFSAAGAVALRGQLLLAGLPALCGLWLLGDADATARRLGTRLKAYRDRRRAGGRINAERDPDTRSRRTLEPGPMSEEEAYQILGLERGASLEEIRAMHRTLMKRLHPDQGGTAGQAALVNAARDRLTNRHR